MSLRGGIDMSSMSGREWFEARLAVAAAQIQALFTAGILGGGLSNVGEEQKNVESKAAKPLPDATGTEVEE